jgi:hypothetical protein
MRKAMKTKELPIHAVILAGGRGPRWRLSRLLSGATEPFRPVTWFGVEATLEE